MMKANQKDILSIQREFAVALVKFSKGSLSVDVAESLSERVISKLDFNNSALAHKGVNWFAKDLLSKIDIKSIA